MLLDNNNKGTKNMFSALKQKAIEKAANVVISVLKQDITMLLGTDARPEDIEIISAYFDGGTALENVKSALEKAGIL
jgi:uncharacterized protein YgbK (DUF1537 family)